MTKQKRRVSRRFTDALRRFPKIVKLKKTQAKQRQRIKNAFAKAEKKIRSQIARNV